MKIQLQLCFTTLTLCAAAVAGGLAVAQSYPAKPLKVIVVVMSCAIIRAITSVGPPAAKQTMTLSGFAG